MRWFSWIWIAVVVIVLLPVVNADDQDQIQELGRGTAECVRWHPHKNYLAVSGRNNLWIYDSELNDIASARVDWKLGCPSWSPDGQFIAVPNSGYDYQAITLYRLTDNLLTEIMVDTPYKQQVLWTADSSQLLIKLPSGISLFEMKELTPQLIFKDAIGMDISPSKRFITIHYDQKIEIYDVLNQEISTSIQIPEATVRQVVWSPDEKHIAVATDDRIDVFEIESHTIIFTKSTEIENSWPEINPDSATLREGIGPIIWAEDNQSLVVSNHRPVFGGTLRVWNIQDDSLIFEAPLGIRVTKLEWSVDNHILLLLGAGGSGYPSVTAYDKKDWTEVSTDLDNGTWRLNPIQSYYLSRTYRSNEIRLLDANDLKLITTFDTEGNRPSDIDWNFDGTLFASVHSDEIQVWEIQSRSRIARRVDHILLVFNGQIHWHPNGTRLMYVSNGLGLRHTYNQANLRIWDIESATVSLNISGLKDPIFWGTRYLGWNSNGEDILMASGSSVRMYDADTGDIIDTYLESEDPYSNIVRSVAWNQGDHEIAIQREDTSYDSIVAIIDDRTGETVTSFPANGAYEVLWRPNSRILTLLRQDGWSFIDVDTGEQRFETAAPLEVRSRLTWSPDGNYLATTDNDLLSIWSVSPDATEVELLHQFPAQFAQVTWYPNSKLLAYSVKNYLFLFDVEQGIKVDSISLPHVLEIESYIGAMAWSPDGSKIAAFVDYQPYLYIVSVSEKPSFLSNN